MPDPNKKLSYIHQQMSGSYNNIPTEYDKFETQLKDDDGFKDAVWKWSKDNLDDVPEYDMFLSDMGLKKKVQAKESESSFKNSIDQEKSPEDIQKIIGGSTVPDQEKESSETNKLRFPTEKEYEEATYNPERLRFSTDKEGQRINDQLSQGLISSEEAEAGLQHISKVKQDIEDIDKYQKEAYEKGSGETLRKEINEDNWRGFALHHPLTSEDDKKLIKEGNIPSNVIMKNEFSMHAAKEFVDNNPIKSDADLENIKSTFGISNQKNLNVIKKHSEELEVKKDFHKKANAKVSKLDPDFVYKNPDKVRALVSEQFPDKNEEEINEYVHKAREKVRKSKAIDSIRDEFSEYMIQTGAEMSEDEARIAYSNAQDEAGLTHLTTNEKQAYALSRELLDLQSQEERSGDDITRINTLKKEINNLVGTDTQLIDDKGNLIDKDLVDQETYSRYTDQQKSVNKLAKIYSQGDIQTLRRARDIARKEIDIANKALTEYEAWAKVNTQREVGQGMFTEGDVINRITNPGEAETLDQLKEEVKVAQNNYLALNKAVMTNADPAGLDKGFYSGMKIFGTNVAEGLLGMFVDDPDIGFTDLEYRQIYPQAAPLTSVAQKEAGKMTTGEYVAMAGGQSIPAVLQLVAFKKLGAPASRTFGELAKGLVGQGKMGKFLSTTMKAAEEGAQFEMSGMGFSTGVGEFLAQESLNIEKIARALPKNKFFNTLARIGAGATAETIAEYSGDIVNEMVENGVNIVDAMETSFGKTDDERLNKLIATLVMTFGMSGASNITNNLNSAIDSRVEKLGGEEYKDYDKVKQIINDLTTEEHAIQEPSPEKISIQPEAEVSEGVREEDLAEEPTEEGEQAIEEQPISEEVQRPDVRISAEKEEVLAEPKPFEEKAIDIKVGGKTMAGDYIVNIKEGEIEVTDSEGNQVEFKPNDALGKKVYKTLRENTDFSEGSKIVPEEGMTEVEYDQKVASESNNPNEIIEAWEREVEIKEQGEGSKEDWMDTYLQGQVNRDSFKEFGDPNVIGKNIAGTYFNPKGSGLDQIAQDVSEVSGVEVSPQDLVDFMLENPTGIKAKTELQNKLEQRFGEVTGLPLNPTTIQIAKEQQTQVKEVEQEAVKTEDIRRAEEEADAIAQEEALVSQAILEEGESIEDITGDRLEDLKGKADDFFNKLKINTEGTLGINIAPAAWNASIDVIRLAVKGGLTLSQAVEKGIENIKQSEWYNKLPTEKKDEVDESYINSLNNMMSKVPRKTTIQKKVEGVTQSVKESTGRIQKEYKDLKKSLRLEEKISKKAEKATRKDIDEQRKDIDNWIKENKSDINRLKPGLYSTILNKINRATKTKSQKRMDDAIDYLDKKLNDAKLIERSKKREEGVAKLDKKTKKPSTSLTPETIKQVGRIRGNMTNEQLSSEDVQEQIIKDINKAQKDLNEGIITNEEFNNELDRLQEDYFEAGFTNINEKSLEQVEELNKQLDEVLDESRAAKKAKNKEYSEKLNKDKSGTEKAALNGKELRPSSELQDPTKTKQTLKRLWQGWKTFRNKMESWEGLLDVFNIAEPMKEVLVDPIHKAEQDQQAMLGEYINEITDKKAEIFEGKEEGRKATEEALKYKNLGKFTDLNGVEVDWNFNLDQISYISLLLDNPKLESTFDKMGWTEEMKDAIRNEMDNNPKQKEYAEWVFNEFLPSVHEEISKIHEEVTGLPLPMEKMYVPLRRLGTTEEEADMLNMFKNSASVGSGYLKARTGSTLDLDTKQGLDQILSRYSNDMSRYRAFGKPLKDINRILKDPRVRQAIEQEHGDVSTKIIKKYLEDFSRGGADPSTRERYADMVRAGMTTATLGLSRQTFIKQLTSIPTYMAEADNPLQYVSQFKNVKENLAAWKKLGNSPYMKHRAGKGWDIETADAMALEYQNLLAGKVKKLATKSMFLTKWGDQLAILTGGVPLYNIEYKKAIKEGKTEQEAEAIAYEKFVRSSERAQQSGNLSQKSHFQRGGSVQKLFLMFKTSIIMYSRNARMARRKFARAYDKGDKKEMIKQARQYAMYQFTLPSVFQLVSSMFAFDDDDKEELLTATLKGNLQGFLYIGDAAQHAINTMQGKPFDYSATPAFDKIGKLMESIGELKSENTPKLEDYLEAILRAGDLTGLPVAKGMDLVQDAYKIATGDFAGAKEGVGLALGYSDYVTGAKDRVKDWQLIKETLETPNATATDYIRNKAEEETGYKSLPEAQAEATRLRNLGGSSIEDAKEIERSIKRVTNNIRKYVKEFTAYKQFGLDDDTVNTILSSRHNNEERAKKLVDKKKEMSETEWRQYYIKLTESGLITSNLYKEFDDQKKIQGVK